MVRFEPTWVAEAMSAFDPANTLLKLADEVVPVPRSTPLSSRFHGRAVDASVTPLSERISRSFTVKLEPLLMIGAATVKVAVVPPPLVATVLVGLAIVPTSRPSVSSRENEVPIATGKLKFTTSLSPATSGTPGERSMPREFSAAVDVDTSGVGTGVDDAVVEMAMDESANVPPAIAGNTAARAIQRGCRRSRPAPALCSAWT
jgi:hypothetical protein